MDIEIIGLGLFVIVLIFPKFLSRFSIPDGVTALILGVLTSIFFPEFKDDSVLTFLSVVGITSLFLFSGLEVEGEEIKKHAKSLNLYVLLYILSLAGISLLFHHLLGLSIQYSIVYSLGILTPSAGFIISSLDMFEISEEEGEIIKLKAIIKEIVSIIFLFIVLQINDLKQLGLSALVLGLFFLSVPWFFKFYLKYIAAQVKNSGVPFLVAISLVAAVLSKKLGAYYLVGAFAVGVIGSRFLKYIPYKEEKYLFKSLASFFSVFLPFYFFNSGMKLNLSGFSKESLFLALALIAIFIPFRFFFEKLAREKVSSGVSLSLVPTLVFGLVIVGILEESKNIDSYLIYALVIYTVVCSIFPSLVQKWKNNYLR
ncbi:MAG: cation:proton antiporter [Halobacteriovoraceae bacterium]|nr:cation:proton antiporter [Halobacteriovoraceae bacterium]